MQKRTSLTPKVFFNCSPGFPTLGTWSIENLGNSEGVREIFVNSFGVQNHCPLASQGRKPWAGIREHLRCKKRGLSRSRLPSGNLLFKEAIGRPLVAAASCTVSSVVNSFSSSRHLGVPEI